MKPDKSWKLIYKIRRWEPHFLTLLAVYGVYKLAPLSITLGLRLISLVYKFEVPQIFGGNDYSYAGEPWYVILEFVSGSLVFIVATWFVLAICVWFIYHNVLETIKPTWLQGAITKIEDPDAQEEPSPWADAGIKILGMLSRRPPPKIKPLCFVTVQGVRIGIDRGTLVNLQKKNKLDIGTEVLVRCKPKILELLDLYVKR